MKCRVPKRSIGDPRKETPSRRPGDVSIAATLRASTGLSIPIAIACNATCTSYSWSSRAALTMTEEPSCILAVPMKRQQEIWSNLHLHISILHVAWFRRRITSDSMSCWGCFSALCIEALQILLKTGNAGIAKSRVDAGRSCHLTVSSLKVVAQSILRVLA